jgi:hypothetical protein
MATWKKVIVSGSAISLLDNDSNYLSSTGGGIVSASAVSSTAQGEFTASFNGVLTELDLGLTSTDDVQFNSVTASLQGNVVGDLTGTADTASYVQFANIDGEIIATTASFVASDNVKFTNADTASGTFQTATQFSASVVTRIDGLEQGQYDLEFSGSTGNGVITDAETLSILGGTNVDTVAAGNSLTINLDDTISLSQVTASIVSASNGFVGDLTGNADTATTSSYVAASSPSQGTVRITGNDIDLGLQVGDSPVFADLRLTGNLTVEGTRTELNVANLNVEDQFILLNSGSATGDVGIIFGGADTTGINTGSAIFYDDSESVFAYGADVKYDDTTATAASKLGNIVELGTGGTHNMAGATFQGVGTILVDNADDIWIQVGA